MQSAEFENLTTTWFVKDLQLALCRVVIESLGQRVQRITKCSSRKAGRVDGCSNPDTTANVFVDKYEDLLNNCLIEYILRS